MKYFEEFKNCRESLWIKIISHWNVYFFGLIKVSNCIHICYLFAATLIDSDGFGTFNQVPISSVIQLYAPLNGLPSVDWVAVIPDAASLYYIFQRHNHHHIVISEYEEVIQTTRCSSATVLFAIGSMALPFFFINGNGGGGFIAILRAIKWTLSRVLTIQN